MKNHRSRPSPVVRAGQGMAVLAGGLAIGISAACTVAAWQDPETASASFTAGTFQTQSQSSGSQWEHHTSGSPAILAIADDALAPGGTAAQPTAGASQYAWLNLRTKDEEDQGGTGYLNQLDASGPLADELEYRLVVRGVSTTECTAADFGASATYLAGSQQSYRSVSANAPEPKAFAISGDGAGLCLELRVAKPGTVDDGKTVQGSRIQLGLLLDVEQN